MLLRTASVLALAGLAATSAGAQTYRCQNANGSHYYADRPCAAVDAASMRLPPAGAMPEASRTPVVVSRTPEHQKYMGSECASLADGLRAASMRTLSRQAFADLRTEYDRRCREEEIQARQRVAREAGERSRERHEERSRSLQATQHGQAQAQATFAQCGEMRRIIAAKNDRIATLTQGEVADLRRFEGVFQERCAGR